jgi:hypothetical protein
LLRKFIGSQKGFWKNREYLFGAPPFFDDLRTLRSITTSGIGLPQGS